MVESHPCQGRIPSGREHTLPPRRLHSHGVCDAINERSLIQIEEHDAARITSKVRNSVPLLTPELSDRPKTPMGF